MKSSSAKVNIADAWRVSHGLAPLDTPEPSRFAGRARSMRAPWWCEMRIRSAAVPARISSVPCLKDLRWLAIAWAEGPIVRAYAPYSQSERRCHS